MKGKTGFFKTLRGGLFFKYFLSYFLVFSVPLLLTLFVYSSSARISPPKAAARPPACWGCCCAICSPRKTPSP